MPIIRYRAILAALFLGLLASSASAQTYPSPTFQNLTILGTCTGCPGGAGVPGGSPGQGQYNNSGIFGGSSGLTLSATKITGMAIGLGSDATGDIYYLNSGGLITRLGIGSTGQVLTVSGGLPAWANATGGGNFSGPGSAVSGNLVSFNGTSGTLGQDSLVAAANVVTASGTLASNALMLGGGSKSAGVLGSLGTTTTVLHGNGSGAPTFGAITLTADVSGLLPVANGGTGIGTLLAGTVPMGAGTSPLIASEITDVASGGVLIGSPTGGQKGAGTINMTGCFINNVACGSGGSVTSVGLSVPATSILSVTGSPVTTAGVLALATTGTSGGIPYFSSTSQLASSGLLGANLPLFGGGSGASPIAGTRSGNTTEVGTVSGALTSGNCVKSDASGNLVDAATTCGGGGTPVAFTSVATGSANAYAMTTTPSSGFSLANSPLVCGPISATNTAASTLNVNAGGTVAIDKQTITGLSALVGGEMVASNTTYCFQYNVAATAWVLQTQLASNVVNNATSATVTAAQWANGTVFNVTTAAQTITLPVATSLSPLGGIFVNAIGNSVTIAPNAADGINGGSIGSSVTVSSGVGAWVFTVGSSGTGALTANPLTGGGGSGTVTSAALAITPTWLSVAGSPITTAGTFTVTATSGQTANQVLATPNGSTGAVGLRALVNADQSPSTVSALTDASSLTVAAPTGVGTDFTLAMSANSPYTLNNPAAMVAGQWLHFYFTEDATGGRTVGTYGTQYAFPAGTPVFNTAANAVNVVSCKAKDTTHAICFGGAASGAQLAGTTTNDNATAGNVGEDVKSTISSGSAVALTTVTTANVTSISLTAGDWDVCGAVGYVAGSSTVTTFLDAGFSTTSATLPTPPYGYVQTSQALALTGNILPSQTVPCIRESLASTTTVFLTVQGSFITSTLSAYGYIEARRRR